MIPFYMTILEKEKIDRKRMVGPGAAMGRGSLLTMVFSGMRNLEEWWNFYILIAVVLAWSSYFRANLFIKKRSLLQYTYSAFRKKLTQGQQTEELLPYQMPSPCTCVCLVSPILGLHFASGFLVHWNFEQAKNIDIGQLFLLQGIFLDYRSPCPALAGSVLYQLPGILLSIYYKYNF